MNYPYQAPGYPGAYPYYMNPYLQAQTAQPVQPQAAMPAQSPPAAPQPASAIGHATQAAPAMQNGGFAFVRSEQEARDYPVAPGNYMTFKDEHAPFLYEKSKSFSQLDEPMFEKYRLIKETGSGSVSEATAPDLTSEAAPASADDLDTLNNEIEKLRGELEEVRGEVESLKRHIDHKPAGGTVRGKKGGDE